jgi:hypothetical protein
MEGVDYMHSYMKQGLGWNQSYDPLKMMKYGSNHERKYMFSSTIEEYLFEENP